MDQSICFLAETGKVRKSVFLATFPLVDLVYSTVACMSVFVVVVIEATHMTCAIIKPYVFCT